MIQRRSFLAGVAAIVCAPWKALTRKPSISVDKIARWYDVPPHTVNPLSVGDCGGWIVPKEFESAILMNVYNGDVNAVSYRILDPPLTLEEVCRLRGVPYLPVGGQSDG